MKMDYGWYAGGNGTNSSGFSGLPGGDRTDTGGFNLNGLYGHWWSSSPSGTDAWFRVLFADNENVGRFTIPPLLGLSVRCIQNAE